MKIKNFVAVLIVVFALVSCAPAVKVVPTETAIPTFTPIITVTPLPKATFTLTYTPTATPISATPTPGYVDSGINFWLPGLKIKCDIGTVAGHSYLQVLPDSCSFPDASGTQHTGQNMPPMLNSIYSFTLIGENNKPVDFVRFPVNGIIEGWGVPNSKIGVMFNSPYMYGLMMIDGQAGHSNFGAVVLKDGRIVMFIIHSAGPAPTPMPGVNPPKGGGDSNNDSNDDSGGNPPEPPDPPEPGETPHG